MRKFLMAGAVAAASLFAANSASAATVVLYSTFESPDVATGSFQIFAPPTVVDGWTSYTGAGIEIQDHAAGDPAPTGGDQFVELDSNNNSSMYFTLAKTGWYSLSFLYSPRPGVSTESNTIDVFVDGVGLGFAQAPGGSTTSWGAVGASFYANAGQKLIFAAAGTSESLGGYVDNISVSYVPEPATWAMMIAGFGLAGSAIRRRRAAAAFA